MRAAVLGVTVLDLQDACETMKDMHDLNAAIGITEDLDENVSTVCGMKVQLPDVESVWSE